MSYKYLTKEFHSMLKKSVLISIGLGITTLSAGFLDDLKSDVVNAATNNVEKKAETKVEKKLSVHSSAAELGKRRVPTSNTEATKGKTSMELGKPDASLIALTECTDLKMSNIMTGYDGTYTFKNGFKTEKRTGFLKREKGKVSNGCILPSLNPRQVVYLEVDSKKFKALGSSNDWSMQCIRSANPEAGALGEKQSSSEYAKVNYLSKKEMMLHCGNSEGIQECAKGSNSSRAGAWKKKLEKAGKEMISVQATKSQLAPKGGEKLYCQYYNSKSGKSLFAFEYIRIRL